MKQDGEGVPHPGMYVGRQTAGSKGKWGVGGNINSTLVLVGRTCGAHCHRTAHSDRVKTFGVCSLFDTPVDALTPVSADKLGLVFFLADHHRPSRLPQFHHD